MIIIGESRLGIGEPHSVRARRLHATAAPDPPA